MTTLYLDGLALTGTVPASLGSLTLLETLELDHNFLSGTVPASFISLTRLKDLCVHAAHSRASTATDPRTFAVD